MDATPLEDDAGSAEISFTATVMADELRFHEIPTVSITFPADPHNHSGSGARRVNLPDESEGVVVGVVYRQCRVDYALASTIDPDLRLPQ